MVDSVEYTASLGFLSSGSRVAACPVALGRPDVHQAPTAVASNHLGAESDAPSRTPRSGGGSEAVVDFAAGREQSGGQWHCPPDRFFARGTRVRASSAARR